ncbi:phage tape measure protein (plasmid) [Planctopirus limnophila DSM 3776]|uniref:Phage tape measure protein n=1 Tax=Planctopirus limnophila (strain ATCC 43296 / DSM 3776 / IFAM 1008 / Mu 290) TaxID=521674 RepID=D5SZF0_PLAL2|nr:phage tape measure protein [Planctopirus limnophila DSM 3776]
MATAGILVTKLVSNTAGFGPPIKAAGRDVSQFAGIVEGTRSRLGGLVAAGAGALGITSLAGALGFGIKLAADAEQAEVAFGTLFQSTDKAKAMLGQLNQFAAETPFESPELVSAARMLASFGTQAGDIVPNLRRIGDVAAGTGQPIAELAELYGKAKVQGRLMGEDINQLTGRGIPIIGQLAKQFGVAESEVKKLVEQGKVGFPQLEQAFIDMTSNGGMFAGMMQAQSQTLTGMTSTLMDNAKGLLRSFGAEVIAAFDLKGGLASGIEFIASLQSGFDTIRPLIQQTGNVWRAFVGFMGAGWSGLMGEITSSTGSTFGGITNWIMEALVMGEFLFQNFGDVIYRTFIAAQLSAVTFFNEMVHFFSVAIPEYIRWFGDNFPEIFMTAADTVLTVLINLGENIRNIFSEIWKFISSGGSDGLNFDLKPLTEGIHNSIREMPNVPERVVSETEAALQSQLNDMDQQLGQRYGELDRQRANAMQAQSAATAELLPSDPANPAAAGAAANKNAKAALGASAFAGTQEAYAIIAKASAGPQKKLEAEAKKTNEQLKQAVTHLGTIAESVSQPVTQDVVDF